jgi:hypothetical protein
MVSVPFFFPIIIGICRPSIAVPAAYLIVDKAPVSGIEKPKLQRTEKRCRARYGPR